LFLGDLPSYTPPFRRVRCSHYTRMSHGMPRFSSDHTTGLSACRVVLGVAEAFRAARLALLSKLYLPYGCAGRRTRR
jgi:hypothetical protein